jgi:protein phosphatase
MKHNPRKYLSDISLGIEVGQASHIGMVRSLNEDSFLTMRIGLNGASDGTSLGLYAVADGVGGYEGGEVASELALKTLSVSVVKSILMSGSEVEHISLDGEFMLKALAEGVKAANKEVYLRSQIMGNGMGTTMAAVLIMDNTAYIANVGDSRVYLMEGEHLKQITTDHSLVAALVAAGEITQEEIYTHPRRNIITRCLGTEQEVKVDVFVEELKKGRSLSLCSDGLWEMVRDNDIKEVLLKADNAQMACERLIEVANQNGGVDNISVIVVKICA